ncbi:MAG: flagellin, partial [Oscillospiraceae bacterium]|nr:flagellin [Oscillospiraceae bacterium]
AISEKMRADVAIYDQAIRNANDGISMVQTAEGALTEVHSMLNRLVTLSTQAANGTYSGTDTGNITKEVTALCAEITRIASDTKFNGLNAFGGAKFQVSESSKISMAAITVPTVSITAGSAAIATLKGHINTVSQARADLGAVQNRLEHTVNNLGVTMENLQNAESQIRDTNVADEMMKYTKNNILIQSAQAMLAQANQVPQGVLQLMQ